MHRTVSLDYGVLLEGKVNLVQDSGETRAIRRGDMCVQRATMHAWRNTSKTEWAGMLYVLQPAQKLTVSGNELREDYGGMKNVKASGVSESQDSETSRVLVSCDGWPAYLCSLPTWSGLFPPPIRLSWLITWRNQVRGWCFYLRGC